MEKRTLFLGALTLSAFLLQGCLVTTKTYTLRRDRVDQNLSSGNRGYLQGRPPADADNVARKTSRVTQVIEMEFGSPEAVKQKPAAAAPQAVQYAEPMPEEKAEYTQDSEEEIEAVEPEEKFQKYTVQKNDTLQKISMKFFGTTKKWYKIFKANGEALKGPNKIYPGQVINIPLEEGKLPEPQENLK